MMELDQAAKEAGITVMNEIGLGAFLYPKRLLFLRLLTDWNFVDPGVDHLCKDPRWT